MKWYYQSHKKSGIDLYIGNDRRYYTREQLKQYGYMFDPLAESVLSEDKGDRCIEVRIRAGACDACKSSHGPHYPRGRLFLNRI